MTFLLFLACSPPIEAPTASPAVSSGVSPELSAGQLHLEVQPAGATVTRGTATLSLALIGVGRGADVVALADAAPELDGRDIVQRWNGVEMWWSATSFGMAHGWVLDAPPAGQGHVTLDVALDDVLVEVSPDETSAILTGADGRRWRYDSLAAWDASARPLPAWIETDGATLTIVVDDRGATYPIEVDPLVSSPDVLSVTGTGPFCGGDFNGDGYADVATLISNTIRVYFGSAAGISTVTNQSFASPLAGTNRIENAGDINSDGRDDMLMAYSNYGGGRGRVVVCKGGSGGLPAACNTFVTGTTVSTHAGTEMAGLGDVNGDGYDDVGVSDSLGYVTVYLGGRGRGYPASWSSIATARQTTGDSLAAAGDVNGDGYADILTGDLSYGGGLGVLYVNYMHRGGVLSTQVIEHPWGAYYGYCGSAGDLGRSVASAGDVNGDGYAEVMGGAPYDLDTCLDGYTYLFYGSSSGAVVSSWTEFSGYVSGNSMVGRDLSGPADLNGDGYGDVVLAGFYGEYAEGRSGGFLLSGGGAEDPEPTTAFATPGGSNYAELEIAGDVNGDGRDDVVVRRHDGATDRYEVYEGS